MELHLIQFIQQHWVNINKKVKILIRENTSRWISCRHLETNKLVQESSRDILGILFCQKPNWWFAAVNSHLARKKGRNRCSLTEGGSPVGLLVYDMEKCKRDLHSHLKKGTHLSQNCFPRSSQVSQRGWKPIWNTSRSAESLWSLLHSSSHIFLLCCISRCPGSTAAAFPVQSWKLYQNFWVPKPLLQKLPWPSFLNNRCLKSFEDLLANILTDTYARY